MASAGDVLSADEAAQFLGVHVETIRRLARNGEFPAFKVGRGWRVQRAVLLKWAETQHFPNNRNAILVVDDDIAVLTVMRQILERQNCRVLEALDGARGLALLDHQPVDAIFLDLQMPEMTGPEFLRELRRNHLDLPVTLMTGYPDSDLVMEASRHGPVTLLIKPMQKQPILQALRGMVGGSSGLAHETGRGGA